MKRRIIISSTSIKPQSLISHDIKCTCTIWYKKRNDTQACEACKAENSNYKYIHVQCTQLMRQTDIIAHANLN